MSGKKIVAFFSVIIIALSCYAFYQDERAELLKEISSLKSINEENKKSIDELTTMRNNLIDEKKELTDRCTQLENQIASLQASKNSSSSSANSNSTTQKTSRTVYITNTGSKYHRSWCSYLRQSKKTISLNNAINKGYTACSRCNP